MAAAAGEDERYDFHGCHCSYVDSDVPRVAPSFSEVGQPTAERRHGRVQCGFTSGQADDYMNAEPVASAMAIGVCVVIVILGVAMGRTAPPRIPASPLGPT